MLKFILTLKGLFKGGLNNKRLKLLKKNNYLYFFFK